jgi:type I restriction enzyme M protein
LIDGSEIYKAQRAQNEISPENVKTLYELYTNYTDVIERCKIVTIQDVEDGGFDLSVKKYIEKKQQETVPPEVVRKRYFEALENVRAAEDKMKELLIEGGYVNE